MHRAAGSRTPQVAFFLPHLGGGGTERMVATLANGLAARGYVVDMVLVQAGGIYLETLAKEISIVNLHSANSYLAVPGLAAYLRRSRPEVLVSSLSLTNVLALIARWLAGSNARVAVRIESTVSAQRRTPWKKALEKPLLSRTYPWADRIIAVSKAVAADAAEYLSISRDKIHVIYNPVLGSDSNVVPEQDIPHPWLNKDCPPVILAVGRLVAVKDFPLLLRAFALVRRQRDCRLMILGEGEDRQALTELAAGLGISEHVLMPGFVQNAGAFMHRSAAFVLSSRYEGLPTALIEAMANGCPVISTDCPGGSREILADGAYGDLVPVGDAAALAAAIERVLDGHRKSAPPSWLEQFTLNTSVDQHIKLLGLPRS